MRWPVDKVYVTQGWGADPGTYARFGLKGHNGIDLRLHDKSGNRATTAEVFAPHSGKVIETGFDAKGYGNYLKIENSKEGSILAHLKSFNVSVGQSVAEGKLVAMANNTGFSSGAHLHWGYYPIPRYRDNGYSGTINQKDLIGNTPVPTPPDDPPPSPSPPMSDQTKIDFGFEIGVMELQRARSEIRDGRKAALDNVFLKDQNMAFRKKVESLESEIEERINEAVRVAKSNEQSFCQLAIVSAREEERLKQEATISEWKIKYESLLLKKTEDLTFWQLLSAMFNRRPKEENG